MRRALAAAAVCAVLSLLGAELTSARSCAGLTEDSLRSRGVAVVAELTRIETLPGQADEYFPEQVFHIRVLEVVKGEKRISKGHVVVRDPCWNFACGLDGPVGRRFGLVLRRRGGHWRASDCSQTTPQKIRNLFGDVSRAR